MTNSKELSEKERKVIGLVNKCIPANKIVADLGCGPNPMVNHVQCKTRITVDFDPDNHPDSICDLNKSIELPSDSVDICIAAEVLEHIYYSMNFMREVRRILTDNGYLIVVVPNICCLSYRLKFLFGGIPLWAARGDLTYKQYGVPGTDGGHVRDYNFKELETLLIDNGFNVIDRTCASMPYTRRLRLNILDSLLPKTFAEKIVIRAQKT